MRLLCSVVLISLALSSSPSAAQVPSADYQIAAAEMTMPSSLREGATVFGYVDEVGGDWSELRTGENGLSCRVSSFRGNRLNVFCLPESMGPVMDRSRELRDSGVSGEELGDKLQQEIDEGSLAAPPARSVAYAFRGEEGSYGKDLDEVRQSGNMWQLIMMPFATAAELGVPSEPEGSMPWLMAEGTGFAHLMVYGDPEADMER